MEKSKRIKNDGGDIKIPLEFIDKIDSLIRSGSTLYTSRDDFIKSAIEVKLLELKMLKPLKDRRFFPP